MRNNWMYHDQTDVTREDCQQLALQMQPILSPLENKTILVTGAAGFLLGHLVETIADYNMRLADRPIKVIAADNFSTGSQRRLGDLTPEMSVSLLQADITEPLSLNEPVHFIIHGASIASPAIYRQYPFETIWANVDGTRHLLDLAREHPVEGFALMSSSEIYGNPDAASIPTPEDYNGHVSCIGPRACYDESKRLAETLASTAYRKYGLPTKIIRPFNVYGPGLRLDDQRVFPDLLRQAIMGEDLTLLSDGRPTRSFCYVQDAVAAILAVLVKGKAGEAYNIGNGSQEISMSDLAELIAEHVPSTLGLTRPNVIFKQSDDPDYLTDNPDRRCPDLQKVETDCGYSPGVTLREGVVRCLRHYHQRFVEDLAKTQQPVRASA